MKLTHKLILTLALSILITACSDDEQNVNPSTNVASDTKETIVTKTEKPIEYINLNAKATNTADGRVLVTGQTNLPEDTRLMVSMSNKTTGYRAQDKSSVVGGKFSAGPFGFKTGLTDGVYLIDISMPASAVQPKSVQAIIGKMGENLTGDLVVKGEIFGSVVEKQITHTLGTTGAIEKATTQDEELAISVKDSVEQLLIAGRSMEALRTSNSANDLRKCGTLMRENQPIAEALDKQADELPMSYLQLKVAASDIYMCVSCLESSASEACDRVTESIKDF